MRVTILSIESIPGARERMAKCICHCGTHFSASYSKVNLGQTRSCGCLKRAAKLARVKHGMRNTKEYKVWWAMKNRCFRPLTKSYPNYGGRGITVCDLWKNSFENFIKDMGRCPEGLTLERNDVNGNYEPSNCRWATTTEQSRNRRNSIMVDYHGSCMNLADVADLTRVSYEFLKYRVKKGMAAEEAVRLYQDANIA